MKQQAYKWNWPDWVPIDIQQSVEKFWDWHNGPEGYQESASRYSAPPIGTITTERLLTEKVKWDTGRYVHAWNNMGRLVHEDGTFSYVSIHYPLRGTVPSLQQPAGESE